MKKRLILLLLASAACHAETLKGITETGDEVILKDDRIWCYVNPTVVTNEGIALNPREFNKPAASTFPVRSKKNDCSVWIETKRWSFERSTGGATEYTFELKGEDAYGMMINEAIQMEVEPLAQIALENARAAASDVEVVKKEYRMVNGKKVIFMQMAGTISGMKFTYLGYYYSDKSGSTQLVAYTGTALVEKYRAELESFLNGLSVEEKADQ